jgi:hypothetical protein
MYDVCRYKNAYPTVVDFHGKYCMPGILRTMLLPIVAQHSYPSSKIDSDQHPE